MLYGLVIFIHVTACLVLIAVILLQAGRGGGLSETFGIDSQQTIFGTKANVFLQRATVAAACLFLIMSLLLGVLTSRRGKSLIDLKQKMPIQQPVPFIPLPAAEPETTQAEPLEESETPEQD